MKGKIWEFYMKQQEKHKIIQQRMNFLLTGVLKPEKEMIATEGLSGRFRNRKVRRPLNRSRNFKDQ